MHFETILSFSVLRQRILTSCALTSSCLDDFSNIVTYCNDNNIFLGGSWAVFFGGVGELLPLKFVSSFKGLFSTAVSIAFRSVL